MPTNPDFRDLFSALCDADAEFIVVGAHAVMFYTVPRFTKDLDVWVRPTRENAERVLGALVAFGAPLADLSVDDLCAPDTIFQIGIAPNRIDIVTHIDGVTFDRAWDRAVLTTYGGVPIRILGEEDLIANKRATGRPQDLLDLEWLERARRRREQDGEP